MTWFSLIMWITFLSACGTSENLAVGEQKEVGFDIREMTASAHALPSFLMNAHEDIANVYAMTVHEEDLLEHIPCYCGCGESARHRNVFDCFVHQKNDDGTVIWDNHGMKCGVCLDIAVESIGLKEQGASPSEIREAIDEKYKEGYATPTKTPVPETT
ncbi:PCYCGC motif-containing (lipo)protein [Aliibacillus thermotolerans]|nr:PCYCGC motif-containing (lipo)protein [Aliibacillus thermotolerans]